MVETLVKMKLANPNPEGGTLKEHISFFELKLNEMNDTRSNYNQKTVLVVKPIEKENEILLKITSELELGVPGRAFTGLSRSLLDEDSEGFDFYFKNNLFHGRLLTFEKAYDNEEEIERISDTELIIRTVTLANKPKSLLTNTEKDILNQMKHLVANVSRTM